MLRVLDFEILGTEESEMELMDVEVIKEELSEKIRTIPGPEQRFVFYGITHLKGESSWLKKSTVFKPKKKV